MRANGANNSSAHTDHRVCACGRACARSLRGPVMRAHSVVIDRNFRSVPRRVDAPPVHSAGIDSDRIMLLRCGPALGWGVRLGSDEP